MDTQATVQQLKQALPAKIGNRFNADILKQITELLNDKDMHMAYRDNLLSYTHVMKDGRFKLSNYIDGVKYISQKLMGKTNIEAFTATFPDKVNDWSSRQISDKDIAHYVSSYNKSKLIGLLYEQTLIPHWVLNQDIYQKAINTQADLMITAKSEKVRADAANSLLHHLKPPETQKVELDIGISKADSAIEALQAQQDALAKLQQNAIDMGSLNAEDVANQPLGIKQINDVKNANKKDPDNDIQEAEYA